MFLIHKYTNVQGLGFLLGTCTLLRKQHSLDVRQDSALGNGDSSKKLVQLLVIPDSKLQVPWDDTRLLVVPGSIASQLQDLSRQVLHHGCHVHWSTSSNPLGIVALPEQSVDPAHRELEACSAGARLGLSLDLTALTTSRHGCHGCNRSLKKCYQAM